MLFFKIPRRICELFQLFGTVGEDCIQRKTEFENFPREVFLVYLIKRLKTVENALKFYDRWTDYEGHIYTF